MENKSKIVMRVSRNTMIGNILLSAFKLLAGIFANSGAMLSDAIHSASDVFSTIVVLIGFHMSEKESDEDHPYGHERLECIAAILLATILCLTGIGIGLSGIQKIVEADNTELQIPGTLALIAAVISIAVKEGMYWYTKKAAMQINSSAVMADAWHHRSDALSSIGSLIGIAGARMGFPVCDPIASVVICIFIVKASYDIFKDAVNKLTDKACDQETNEQILILVKEIEGVQAVDMLHTRMFGSKIYVDIEIRADGKLSLIESHEIAQNVHDSIEAGIKDVKHCMVHVNPE